MRHFFLALITPSLAIGIYVFSDNREYYIGGNNFDVTAYLILTQDTAVVEIIQFQKFPRKLLIDSLYYDNKSDWWYGKSTKAYKEGKRFYLTVLDNNSPFYRKKPLLLKRVQQLNHSTLDSIKKDALWNDLFSFYRQRGLSDEFIRSEADVIGLERTLPFQEYAIKISILKKNLEKVIK